MGRGLERGRALSVFTNFSRQGRQGDQGGGVELGNLEDIGCADCGESEKGLEDEAATDGEGIMATVVAFFVEAMDRLKPLGRMAEEVSNSCYIVGQN